MSPQLPLEFRTVSRNVNSDHHACDCHLPWLLIAIGSIREKRVGAVLAKLFPRPTG